MGNKTSLGGVNHYAALRRNIGSFGGGKSHRGPSLTLKEASDKFDLPVRTLAGWMKTNGAPKPFAASQSSRNTYYDAKELTLFVRAKLAAKKEEA